MLRAGCIVLSIWLILNVIPSCTILATTLSGNGHTPAINVLLDDADVANLSAETLATIDSIAVFANGLNIAFCTLAVSAVWMGLHRRIEWVFWALTAGFTCAILAGAGADFVVGTLFPHINLISLGIVTVGLGLAATALFRKP